MFYFDAKRNFANQNFHFAKFRRRTKSVSQNFAISWNPYLLSWSRKCLVKFGLFTVDANHNICGVDLVYVWTAILCDTNIWVIQKIPQKCSAKSTKSVEQKMDQKWLTLEESWASLLAVLASAFYTWLQSRRFHRYPRRAYNCSAITITKIKFFDFFKTHFLIIWYFWNILEEGNSRKDCRFCLCTAVLKFLE